MTTLLHSWLTKALGLFTPQRMKRRIKIKERLSKKIRKRRPKKRKQQTQKMLRKLQLMRKISMSSVSM